MKFKVGDVVYNLKYGSICLVTGLTSTCYTFISIYEDMENFKCLVGHTTFDSSSFADKHYELWANMLVDNTPQVLDNNCRCPIFDLMSVGCKCGGK